MMIINPNNVLRIHLKKKTEHIKCNIKCSVDFFLNRYNNDCLLPKQSASREMDLLFSNTVVEKKKLY